MIHRLIRTYREAYGGLPHQVWLISVVLLISRSGTMVIPFLSLYFTKELGFTPTQIGWLLGIYGVGGINAGLIGGQLTQRIGAIPTQLLSLALTGPAFLMLGQVESFAGAGACLFGLAIVAEGIRPASVTATVNFCANESQHAKALAVNRLAVNLGMTIGPAVGGFLATIDFSLLFYVNAAGVFGAFLFLLSCFGIPRRSEAAREKESKITGTSPWSDGTYLIFLVLTMLASLTFFQLMGPYPLYLEEHYHLKEYHIGALFAINTILIVLLELILINYVQGLSILRVVAYGQLFSCLGFGILPWAVGSSFNIGLAYCAFTIVIWTIGEMFAMPLGAAFAAQRSNENNRGRYMGLYVTSFSIAAVIGPLGGMWIYDLNPHALWYFALVIGGIVFFGLLKLNDYDTKSRKQESLPKDQ